MVRASGTPLRSTMSPRGGSSGLASWRGARAVGEDLQHGQPGDDDEGDADEQQHHQHQPVIGEREPLLLLGDRRRPLDPGRERRHQSRVPPPRSARAALPISRRVRVVEQRASGARRRAAAVRRAARSRAAPGVCGRRRAALRPAAAGAGRGRRPPAAARRARARRRGASRSGWCAGPSAVRAAAAAATLRASATACCGAGAAAGAAGAGAGAGLGRRPCGPRPARRARWAWRVPKRASWTLDWRYWPETGAASASTSSFHCSSCWSRPRVPSSVCSERICWLGGDDPPLEPGQIGALGGDAQREHVAAQCGRADGGDPADRLEPPCDHRLAPSCLSPGRARRCGARRASVAERARGLALGFGRRRRGPASSTASKVGGRPGLGARPADGASRPAARRCAP